MAGRTKEMEAYQRRVVSGAAGKLRSGRKSVLVQAPTGAGKSAMMGGIAAAVDSKVLILTHRRALFEQLAGAPDKESEKDRMGEIAWWGGVEVGRIADQALGGTDQSPAVVVAMVETAANMIEDLESYGTILVDETHHMSAESNERAEKGSYARILDAFPDADLVGFTATIFRGDGDKLHPRLEEAHREVVSIDEARAAGRIVPARTIIGRVPLSNGRTPHDLAVDQLAGRDNGGRSASAITRDLMNDEFYERAVEDWDRLADRRKTIVFVDSTKDVDRVAGIFARQYGAGIAAGIHGSQSDSQNEAARAAYERGEARVLVSCQMIGEGYNVPATDAVMSFNASLSRAEMNQYVGRAIRSREGKTEGLFLDYGTATAMHGAIEHQHQLQNIDAMTSTRSMIEHARAIGRATVVAQDGWSVIPGENRNLYIRPVADGFTLLEEKLNLDRDLGRRRAAGNSHTRGIQPVPHPDKRGSFRIAEASRLIADHVRNEASFIARQGGLEGEVIQNLSHKLLGARKTVLSLYSEKEERTPDKSEAATRRREIVAQSLQGTASRGIDSRLVERALSNSANKTEVTREALALSGMVFEAVARSGTVPLGLRAEAREITPYLSERKLSQYKPHNLVLEAQATGKLLERLSKEMPADPVGEVAGHLRNPVLEGSRALARELKSPKSSARE